MTPGKPIGIGLSLSLLLATTICVPLLAGSRAIGTVVGSTNATLEGQPPFPNALVFTGQSLTVKDGAAVISLTQGSRLVFGRETTAVFRQEEIEPAVLLRQGTLLLYHNDSARTLRIRAGDISVVPELGFKTVGEVALLNGAVVVHSKLGMLRVEGSGSPVEVPQGRMITIQPRSARGPQVGASGGSHITTVAAWIGLGTGVLATIVGFDALHRANDANDAAARAGQAAATATQAAAAASSAALAATQAASAATSLASAAATLGLVASNAVGCDLNKFANSLGQPSPYTPPSGLACH
jgi:hypothetical protein